MLLKKPKLELFQLVITKYCERFQVALNVKVSATGAVLQTAILTKRLTD